jgi:hypothetical protein
MQLHCGLSAATPYAKWCIKNNFRQFERVICSQVFPPDSVLEKKSVNAVGCFHPTAKKMSTKSKKTMNRNAREG